VLLPRVDALAGDELLANLALAAVGFLVVVAAAAERSQPSSSP
jgi:hypothetical protein